MFREIDNNLLGCPLFSKCSERSQPKTRSFKIPDFFSFPLVGLDRIKLLKKDISLPCLRKTGFAGALPLPPDDPVGDDSSSSASSESVTESFLRWFCVHDDPEPDEVIMTSFEWI